MFDHSALILFGCISSAPCHQRPDLCLRWMPPNMQPAQTDQGSDSSWWDSIRGHDMALEVCLDRTNRTVGVKSDAKGPKIIYKDQAATQNYPLTGSCSSIPAFNCFEVSAGRETRIQGSLMTSKPCLDPYCHPASARHEVRAAESPTVWLLLADQHASVQIADCLQTSAEIQQSMH